jgi:hypothetical protein
MSSAGSVSTDSRLTNLVLDQELDTLNGGGSGLGDSGGNTTHCKSVSSWSWSALIVVNPVWKLDV